MKKQLYKTLLEGSHQRRIATCAHVPHVPALSWHHGPAEKGKYGDLPSKNWDFSIKHASLTCKKKGSNTLPMPRNAAWLSYEMSSWYVNSSRKTCRERERERPPNLATNGKRVVKHSKVDIQPLDLPMSLGGFNCCWTFNSHHMTVLTKLIKIHRPNLAFGIQDILRWEVKRAQVASNEPS